MTDGVAWQDLPLILNSNLDQSLGVFTNTGANGSISFNLALGSVSLQTCAWAPKLAFT